MMSEASICSPSENGFLCLVMHCVPSELPAVAWCLTALMVVNYFAFCTGPLPSRWIQLYLPDLLHSSCVWFQKDTGSSEDKEFTNKQTNKLHPQLGPLWNKSGFICLSRLKLVTYTQLSFFNLLTYCPINIINNNGGWGMGGARSPDKEGETFSLVATTLKKDFKHKWPSLWTNHMYEAFRILDHATGGQRGKGKWDVSRLE